MSHDKHDKHAKKQKKLEQILKNRHIQIMFDQENRGRARDLELEEEEKKKREVGLSSSRNAAKNAKQAEPVWSAKMQQIRDKNTGRARDAKERWNRFAGTEGGGGRGL